MANLTGRQLIQKAGKLHSAGKYNQAERIYKQLLKANPNDLTILRILGILERDRKNIVDAVDWFTLARQVSDDDPIILAELALTLEQGGKFKRAMDIASEAILKNPTNISVAIFYAKMCLNRGFPSKAALSIEKALKSDPNNPEAWQLLATAANNTGTLPIRLKYAKKLIQLKPQEAQSHTTIATALRLNGDIDDALSSYEHALQLDPTFPEAIAGKVEVLESLGRTVDAEEILMQSPESDSVLIALAKVRIARKLDKPERALQAIDAVLHKTNSTYDQSNLQMHRGRVLEDMGKYDEAWSAWAEGNQLHGGTFPLKDHIKLVEKIIGSGTGSGTTEGASGPVPDPIFIVGMFRSGTTLLEQILGAHPEIDAAGEVDQILRFVKEKPYPECIINPNPQWQQIYLDRLNSSNVFCTDKMPMNYLHVGLIHTLFPNAKIIHTTRNPLDTCVSCFANSFSANHAYTSDLHDLASVYKQYQQIMTHWNKTYPGLLYEVPYEALVDNLEVAIRGVFRHIGVDFNSDCLEFYNVRRIAVTPSADQVRKPIYDSSVGRHEHFLTHLDELTSLQ